MRILPITLNNYNQNKISSPQNFCGLTRMMEKSVLAMPHKTYKKLVANYHKMSIVVGHFPEDILQVIKRNTKHPQQVGARIKKFNMALARQAKLIKDYDKSVIKQIQNLNIDDFMQTALIKASKYPTLDIGYVRTNVKFKLQPEEMEKMLNNDHFAHTMRECGIIGEDESVKLTYAGCGTYKNCFKIEFLDKDGKPIVHPKAFVIGKRENLGKECEILLKKRVKKYIESTPFEEFDKKMRTRIANCSELSDIEKQDAVNEIKNLYYWKHKKTYIYNFAHVSEDFRDINGIFPEANAALKIRKDLGKSCKESDMIEPFLFDVKRECGLLEFADKDLKPVRVMYDFDGHGLRWIDDKRDNYSPSYIGIPRKIDYGCIHPIEKESKYIQ